MRRGEGGAGPLNGQLASTSGPGLLEPQTPFLLSNPNPDPITATPNSQPRKFCRARVGEGSGWGRAYLWSRSGRLVGVCSQSNAHPDPVLEVLACDMVCPGPYEGISNCGPAPLHPGTPVPPRDHIPDPLLATLTPPGTLTPTPLGFTEHSLLGGAWLPACPPGHAIPVGQTPGLPPNPQNPAMAPHPPTPSL